MANNLPPLWRFDIGDYTGLGSVFTKFIANLNLFTQAVYSLLNGGIGFSNMQRAIYSTQVTGGATTTPVSFTNPLPISPSGVTLCQCQLVGKTSVAISSAVSLGTWQYGGKTISILGIAGLVTGDTYNISLEVF